MFWLSFKKKIRNSAHCVGLRIMNWPTKTEKSTVLIAKLLAFWLSKTGSEGTVLSPKKCKTLTKSLITQFIPGRIPLACPNRGFVPFKKCKIHPLTTDQAPQYSSKDPN